MQIILASAKIMSVSIKREQSKLVCSVEREKRGMKSNDKVKSSPDISPSSPRFQNEADLPYIVIAFFLVTSSTLQA